MSDLDFAPRDYAIGDEDSLGEDESGEIVHWYDRPGWPLGRIPPNVAMAGAFTLGILLGAAAALSVSWARDRYL